MGGAGRGRGRLDGRRAAGSRRRERDSRRRATSVGTGDEPWRRWGRDGVWGLWRLVRQVLFFCVIVFFCTELQIAN